jgi:5-amino-6-(5-phosphoribosylamino)uracil reductase
MSIDGYLAGPESHPLRLSNDADLRRVDGVRANSDAILVGASTIRNDNPRLLVRSVDRRNRRISAGLPPSPLKVTVTGRGELSPAAEFFTAGVGQKLVYCPGPSATEVRTHLGGAATVIGGGPRLSMRWVSEDLASRGVRRLMVEGGGSTLTQFLTEGMADELQLAIAPFFVGDSRARRLVDDGRFPWNPDRRAALLGMRQIGDVVMLRYALSARCMPMEPEQCDSAAL